MGFPPLFCAPWPFGAAMAAAFARHEVVEFTGVPACPSKVMASHIEKCHELLVGGAEGGGCAADKRLVCKAARGAVDRALNMARGGRSQFTWKAIRHYYSTECNCDAPHGDMRAASKVRYVLELNGTCAGAGPTAPGRACAPTLHVWRVSNGAPALVLPVLRQ